MIMKKLFTTVAATLLMFTVNVFNPVEAIATTIGNPQPKYQDSDKLIETILSFVADDFNSEDGRKIIQDAIDSAKTGWNGEEGEITNGFIDRISRLTFEEDDAAKGYLNTILTITNNAFPLYKYLMANNVLPGVADVSNIKVDTIAAAPIDEMFYGIGDERNLYNPMGLSDEEIAKGLQEGATSKYNQSYVWGIVTEGNKVYWSTNTNYICTSVSDLQDMTNNSQLQSGYKTDCWVCEYSKGKYGQEVHAKIDSTYAKYSDIRIPRMYCYDPATGVVEDITPGEEYGEEYIKRLQNCQGLRSAGSHNGIVFFGGPSAYGGSMQTVTGASFFAYDTETKKYIGCSNLDNVDGNRVTNVRRWLVYNGVLYCGVRITDKNGVDRGAVLRWYGDKNDPWQFHIVGWCKSEAAELAVYNNRMYVGGWNTATFRDCSLVKGPEIPEDGLHQVDIDAPEWEIIWRNSFYDPNPVSRANAYVGCLQVWKDQLYWGTFTLSYGITKMAQNQGVSLLSPEGLAFVLGTIRQTTLWRVDGNDEIELLFGEEKLPLWNKYTKLDENQKPIGPDTWSIIDNVKKYKPRFGHAGYGNPWAVYTWTMAEYHGDLYLGTNNVDIVFGSFNSGNSSGSGSGTGTGSGKGSGKGYGKLSSMFKLIPSSPKEKYGFEVLRMQDPDKAPEFITENGFGNGTAYGVRNFTICNDELFIGSASPYNIAPNSGWHLFSLKEDTGTNVQSLTVKPAVVFRKEEGRIMVSSIDGKELLNVCAYSVDGKEIFNDTPNSHIGVVPTGSITNSTVIIKVVTNDGKTYTNKMVL